MDVVEETKPRVEGEIVIIHDDEVELLTATSGSQAEQNGAQMMVDEVGSPLVQQEVKSSLSTPQNDEVHQVDEASPQALLKSEGPVTEEKALPVLDPQKETSYVEEFGGVKPASNMRLESVIYETEGEKTKLAECSRIERKFSCSEEASVDVHSDNSEGRETTNEFLKTVSTVDHALLQKNSEEFVGVAQELETQPTLAAKWSHEVSVDVFVQDEWVEAEMHSVAEPEASTSGMASSYASEKPPPSGLVSVEPENRNLTTEHEAQPAIGVIEFEKQEAPQVFEKRTETIEVEKQGRELISQSLHMEEPITGTEREMASPNSTGTQGAFEERKSMNPPEQPLPGSVECESNHSNECDTISQGLQALPIQDGEDPKNAVPTSTQDEDIDLRECLSHTSGEAGESTGRELVSPRVETNNVAESTPCTSESPVLADEELTCERTTDGDSNEGERHAKSTARVPSFADWERVVEVVARTTDTMVEELESTSSPPKQPEGNPDTREQVQRIWSLKNLKKRPLPVEPRAVTEQGIRSLKPKATKVVGLSWPPTPLTPAKDEHYVDTDNAFSSPRQRVAESVGATDTILAEPKEELLESPPEQSEGIDGAEANIEEENPQRIWSLKYLKTRPVTVEPRIAPQQTLKPRAPKVVGLSWPPTPLTPAEDKHYVDTNDAFSSPRQRVAESVGATDTIVAEPKGELLESPPEQSEGINGAEANIEEESLQRIWSLKYLKTRHVMVEPRIAPQQTLNPVKPRAPKVVGLSWPPTPLTPAEDKHDVDTDDAFSSPRQRVAESVGATDIIVAEPKEELLESPPEQSEGIDGAEANIEEESLQRIWSLKYLKTRPVMVEPRITPQQTLKPRAPKVVGLSWPPTPLTPAEDKHGVDIDDAFSSPRQRAAESVGATDTIVAEPKGELLESPPEQSEGIDGAEANIEEENPQRIWSLKYLKTRPVTVEPRIAPQQTLNPVKPKAPKVVGLSWPPTPLTPAEDKHDVDTDDAFSSPRQRVAESVGATDTIVVEPKGELLESPPEQSEGIDGAEANTEEESLQRIWSLKYLKTRPVMVEPRIASQQTLNPVKPRAPKVVGLSWPPTPLIPAEAKHFVDTDDAFSSPRQRVTESVGATDIIVAEPKGELLESPPEQSEGINGAEANIKEQSLQRIWSLEYLKTRPVMVELRIVPQQTLMPVKLKAPKVVGLSWPPGPSITPEGIKCVFK